MLGQIKLKVTKQSSQVPINHDKKITVEDVDKIVEETKKSQIETGKKIHINSKPKEKPPNEKNLTHQQAVVGQTTLKTETTLNTDQQTFDVIEIPMGKQIISFIISDSQKVNIHKEINGKGFWVDGDT